MTVSWRYEVVQKTGSTNSDLLNRWHAHAIHEPMALRAIEQTAGRGRRSNLWLSDPNHSLTFSLAYPFPTNRTMMDLQGLSLVCGLSILKSMCTFLGMTKEHAMQKGLGLKWPNDLLINDRKLGGILIEGGQHDPQEGICMVIGAGINLFAPFENEESIPRAFLNEIHAISNVDVNDLWKFICTDLGNTLEVFSTAGFAAFQMEWNTWNAWKNQHVVVLRDGQAFQAGECLGVNPMGYLQISTKQGLEEVSSGEVSLRKMST
jgi:BirA family transcriptional regulator, biotin operon repressor / biotin---[acetyl-CoA-carboxylase] ligase